jgi:FAD dependent oxidoreductase TIGR03364
MPELDLAIIGAGIAGIAHAWAAARRGRRVTVFERDRRAVGASVRNFGMIWPVGQPAGFPLATALRSRELWLEFLSATGLYHRPVGCIHLATRPDEVAVLEEFAARAPDLGYNGELLGADATYARSPLAKRGAVTASYFSTTEVNVDPRQAIARAPGFLQERHQVEFRFGTSITHVESGQIRTSAGEILRPRQILIASGPDLRTLFPAEMAASGQKLCKLQMLKTRPVAADSGPMIASGLTLRHYANFEICPSLGALKARVATETPELDRLGIHVMVSQGVDGGLILGDSHEYGEPIAPFDTDEIEGLMLRELRRIVDLPTWEIAERWHGVYPKLAGQTHFLGRPQPGVVLFTGLGGSGMTLSFGLADHLWSTSAGPFV